MVLALLAGCGSSDKKDSGSNNSSVSIDEGDFSKADIIYAGENNAAVYKMIKASDLADEVIDKSSELYKALKNAFNLDGFRNVVDKTVEYSADAKEILIGATDRPESLQALEYLRSLNNGRKGDYIICTIGNKVVIHGLTSEAQVAGIQYYIDNYASANVTGGILHTYLTEGEFKDVTINSAHLSRFKVIRPRFNFGYIAQIQIDKMIDEVESVNGYAMDYYYDRTTEAAEYEIIVGDCKRDGVTQITDRDKYEIRVVGKKVYLNGGSASAIAMAVSEFAKLLSKGSLSDADTVNGSYAAAVASYDKKTYYTRTWGDDFDSTTKTTANSDLWFTVPKEQFGNKGHNGRDSIRTTDTNYVYIQDGKFHIDCGYNNTQYIGGMIMTDRTMYYKYGYIELSAIIPDGKGLWTALWLDSRWSPIPEPEAGLLYDLEIDINECYGNAKQFDATAHKHPTDLGLANNLVHEAIPWDNDRRHECPEGRFSDEYHTYGLLWDDDEFTFTCDGEAFYTWANNTTAEDLDAYHQLAYVRLSAAVGFHDAPSGGIISDDDPAWKNSNRFIVDYVHIYQIQDGKQRLEVLKS